MAGPQTAGSGMQANKGKTTPKTGKKKTGKGKAGKGKQNPGS
jgi:hypothetical protein